MTRVPRVVVGVDGSPESVEALRFALREARQRHAELHVVCVHHQEWEGDDEPPEDWVHRLHEQTLAVIDDALHEAAGSRENWPADVVRMVLTGDPGEVLCEQAWGAELLVVGCRGRGAVARAVLGSVSSYCLHHAACPVLVVRHHPEHRHLTEVATMAGRV